MQKILDLISTQPGPLVFVVAVFCYVGRLAVGSNDTLRRSGWHIALLAFVGYLLYALAGEEWNSSKRILTAAFNGLLAAGLALGFSWIALAIVNLFFGGIFGRISRYRSGRRARRERRRQEADRSRSEHDHRMQVQERYVQEQQRQREAAARAKEEVAAKKRRDEARFDCECFYDLHRAKLTEKFSESRLAAYFERYFGNDQPAEEVERRAEQLRATLRELVEQNNNNGHKPQSIIDINQHFDRERAELVNSDMDAERKAGLIAYLEREREEKIRRLYER